MHLIWFWSENIRNTSVRSAEFESYLGSIQSNNVPVPSEIKRHISVSFIEGQVEARELEHRAD